MRSSRSRLHPYLFPTSSDQRETITLALCLHPDHQGLGSWKSRHASRENHKKIWSTKFYTFSTMTVELKPTEQEKRYPPPRKDLQSRRTHQPVGPSVFKHSSLQKEVCNQPRTRDPLLLTRSPRTTPSATGDVSPPASGPYFLFHDHPVKGDLPEENTKTTVSVGHTSRNNKKLENKKKQ